MAKKASLKQLTRSTHKGRGTRTGQNGYSARAGRGISGTNLRIQGVGKLTSPILTGGLSPTPKGPEPGRGGRMY
jgi:hypothetical protein